MEGNVSDFREFVHRSFCLSRRIEEEIGKAPSLFARR